MITAEQRQPATSRTIKKELTRTTSEEPKRMLRLVTIVRDSDGRPPKIVCMSHCRSDTHYGLPALRQHKAYAASVLMVRISCQELIRQ